MSNLATITNNILADSGIDDINVIVSTGSYANPAWITSLAWTKITGVPANIVTGTGTTNVVPKFTGTSTIGDSAISDNTNEVSIIKRLFLNTGGQSILLTPNLGSSVNRIESSNLPLEITTLGSALRLAAGGVTAQLTLASTGVVTLTNLAGTGSRIVVADSSGNLSASSALSGYVQGTGTTNYLPKFTGTSTIGNSNLINDATGNLGLGVTPSAGGLSGYVLFELANGGTSIYSGANQNLNGTNISWSGGTASYKISNFATLYNQQSGQHQWFNAPSGTAGNAISFTQAMTLTSGGNLILTTGTVLDNGARLQVSGTATVSSTLTANGNIFLANDGTYGSSYITLGFGGTSNGSNRIFAGTNSSVDGIFIAAATGKQISFRAGGGTTDHLIINSSGNVGIGTTSPNGKLRIQNDNSTIPSLIVRDGGTPTANLIEATSNAYGNSFIVTATGNVGIGTTSPAEKLDVVGGGLAAGNGTIKTGITYSSLGLIGTFTNHDLGILTNGSIKATITSGGNVLIGTTTDNGARLNVTGNTYISGDLRFGTSYSGASNNTAIVKWQDGSASIPNSIGLFTWADARDIQIGGKDVYFRTEAGVNRMVLTSTGAATFSSSVTATQGNFTRANDGGVILRIGNVGVPSDTYFDFVRSSTTGALSIQGNQTGNNNIILAPTSGNVLIGTTTDAGYRLDVLGNTRVYGASGNDVSFILQSQGASAPYLILNGSLTSYNLLRFQHNGTDHAGIGAFNSNITGGLSFYTNGISSERMRITSSGNVGIGTSSPTPHNGTNALVIQGGSGSRGIMEIWDNSGAGGKAVFQQVGGDTYLGSLAKGSGSGDLFLLVNGTGTSATVSTIFKASGNVLIGTTTDVGARLYVDGAFRTGTLTAGTQTAAVDWRLGNARGGTATANALIRVQINGVLVDLIGNYV